MAFPFSLFKFPPLPRCVALHWLCLHVAPWCIHRGDVTWLVAAIPATPHSIVCIMVAPPSGALLPWFPAESAHDAQCYTFHHVCSTTTCCQHSLRCNSSGQSGLAIYFTCSDLANYSVLMRHSVCFGDWWEILVSLKPFLDLEFFCKFWTDVPALLFILRWISRIGSFNWLQVLLLLDYIYSCCYYTNPQIHMLIFSMFPHWLRIEFTLLPFLVIAFELLLSNIITVVFRSTGKKDNTFLSKAQICLSLPSDYIRNSYLYIKCVCAVLIFICLRFLQAESQGRLWILGKSWNCKEILKIIIV